MTSFWNTLKKPFFALAPMEDVTDVVFRQIVLEAGRPDVFFTEFTNTDGLMHEKGREKVAHRLRFTKEQKPVVAQIWGNNPLHYVEVAKQLVEMGFDGIDINMGCPTVAKDHCAGLINNPALAKEIIEATKEGVKAAGSSIPVSVKTRIGYSKIQTEEWAGFLLEQDLPVLTIHGRTKKEMSKVPAHWDEIGKVVTLRDKIAPKTLIIGNGDVVSYQDGLKKAKEYGVDGIMIGRGIFQNPWIFDPSVKLEEKTFEDRMELLKKHLELFDATWNDSRRFVPMRKFYKMYTHGLSNAVELRTKLMEYPTPKETIEYINTLL